MFVKRNFAGIAAVSLAVLSPTTSALGQGTDLERMLSQSHQMLAQATPAETAPVTQQPAASPLPNGATSITEIFSDWTVTCNAQDGRKVCAMSQIQGNSQTGQQIFAIELYGMDEEGSSGVMLLPFGLDVQTPVTLVAGEQALDSSAAFTTCVPSGCIVPVLFSQAELDTLKAGTALTVTAKRASSTTDPAAFIVSLAGFTAALSRANELSRE